MKTLLEVINRGILRGLTEQNIELLSDLDDDNLGQSDSMKTKNINNKINAVYRYFPKTKEELAEIIKVEVERKGWNCDLNHIDTSKITDMSYLFSKDSAGYGLGGLPGYNLEKFNGDISRWNVSNVADMSHMFYGANSFNQPIGDWDVSNVTNMDYMFFDADSFNRPIGDWDVSNVINMHNMFQWAMSFNQPIGDWDVSNVTSMRWMFSHASSFNQDLSKWKLKHGCDTEYMFVECRIKKEFKPKGIY